MPHVSSQPSSNESTSPNPLHPLVLDSETNEPYLALAAPYSHIVITPSRAADVPVLLNVLNDLRVARYLVSSPFPFTREHAESFISRRRTDSATHMQAIRDGGDSWATGVPVHSVRDMRGTSFADARLIGHVSIKRHDFDEVLDAQEMLRLDVENAAKPDGDPSIVWTIGGSSSYTPRAHDTNSLPHFPRRLVRPSPSWSRNHDSRHSYAPA